MNPQLMLSVASNFPDHFFAVFNEIEMGVECRMNEIEMGVECRMRKTTNLLVLERIWEGM